MPARAAVVISLGLLIHSTGMLAPKPRAQKLQTRKIQLILRHQIHVSIPDLTSTQIDAQVRSIFCHKL